VGLAFTMNESLLMRESGKVPGKAIGPLGFGFPHQILIQLRNLLKKLFKRNKRSTSFHIYLVNGHRVNEQQNKVSPHTSAKQCRRAKQLTFLHPKYN
jgi:hypothetical protein